MPITVDKGPGAAVAITYDPSVVYANEPTDRVQIMTFTRGSGAISASVGARHSAPASHDGDTIVTRRSPRAFAITGNGTSGATTLTNLATTTSGAGTGLTVNLTAAGGVVTAAAVNTRAFGYRVGDTVTVAALTAGTGTAVTMEVTALD